MNASFVDRLQRLQAERSSLVCVGIDPDPAHLPPHLGADHAGAVVRFCTDIIAATEEFACAFKLNFAFFEALGSAGHDAMAACLEAISPSTLTIADAKRGDIGNSARFYARSVFDDLGFDSVTVSPYMGHDSVTPFLQHAGTCAFVLGRTSNPGGDDLQRLPVGGGALYETVGQLAVDWAAGQPGDVGLVVGATDLEAMRRLRAAGPSVPFLVPGVGAQGGDARDVMAASGSGPVIINSSRAILFASGERDFAAAAGKAAKQLAASIEEARS